MEYFTKEQMQEARRANLYDYLMDNHSNQFKTEGRSIHLKSNKSLSIKSGYSGYYDFATGEHGNSVDFLVHYMDYRLDEAVLALCEEASPKEVAIEEELPAVFPPPLPGKYKHLFAYLIKRGISVDTIQMLIGRGLLYQEANHNNIVFANEERDWGELRGTYDRGGTSFHGVVANCRHDGYWSFQSGEDPEVAYICEAAIDAISLYEIHRREGDVGDAFYVSIGGVMKQPAIDRLKENMGVILAVDNDEAGGECRRRNPELDYILPTHKDWNEDLVLIFSSIPVFKGDK